MSPWNPGIEISAVALSDCCITQTDGQLFREAESQSVPTRLLCFEFDSTPITKINAH